MQADSIALGEQEVAGNDSLIKESPLQLRWLYPSLITPCCFLYVRDPTVLLQ